MLAGAQTTSCEWLRAGREIFPAMMEAIEGARRSIRLEFYTYSPGSLGKRFLEVLLRARQRGVEVHLIVDAVGSMNLPVAFWDPLRAAGGHARQFNPLSLNRLVIRDHRKLLVCDETLAIVGGFNISHAYDGDGVT